MNTHRHSIRRAITLCVAVLLTRSAFATTDPNYEHSIEAFLHEHFDRPDIGMVVALVEKDRTRVFAAGKMGGGMDKPVDADTIFEIGSCSKTFTSLLLQEMAHRGEVKLDDPVSKYLPANVKVPSRNGKQITLANLAAQDSGLPFSATNESGANSYERFANYTFADMYEFLSTYTLPQDPGTAFQYSNIGMGVLGHALSLKANASFESLIIERICRPLQMNSTFITITPEFRPRMAQGHDENLKPTPDLQIPAMQGAGAIRSSANDLVKYVAANLAITASELTPLMQEMQIVRHHTGVPKWGNTAMPWFDLSAYSPPGSELIGHSGGTGGFSAFLGLDRQQHCGVVVLSNQERMRSAFLGFRILQHARLERWDPVKEMHIQELTGVGLLLDFDKERHRTLIKGAAQKSPAARAKILAGSVIDSIDGVPTTGKTLEECAALIRGDAGTAVQLVLNQPNESQPTIVKLTREKFLIGE